MQIPTIPPPIVTNALPQDAVAKAVPNVQAAQPIIQRAVDPSPKSEKFNQTRNNRDRSKGGGHPDGWSKDDKRDREGDDGHSVNISI